jgi:hypothetical protein
MAGGQVSDRKPYNEDEECSLCGFPDLDGLWYDGTCDECHDIVIEQSIYKAIEDSEKEEIK